MYLHGFAYSRTERNSDGSFIDNFIKTIIGGRKIHGGGKAAAKVKPIVRVSKLISCKF